MKLFKILAATIGAIIALLVVAGILLAYLFDPNDYKEYLTGFVEDQTGRTLSIEDDLELSYFPWLAIETGDVTLGNHPDFPDAPFATVESLSARVRVWPLLRREIEIGRVVLDGVVVNLALDADGNTNWDDLLASDSGEPEAGGADGTGPAPAASLEIEGVRIDNGRILWREAGEVRYIVSDLNLSTGTISRDEPVAVTLAFGALDVASQRELTAELEARAIIAAGEIRVDNLQTELSVVDAADTERVSGTMRISTVSIRDGNVIEIDAAEIEGAITEPPFVGPERLDVELAFATASFDQAAQSLMLDGLTTNVNGIGATWRIAGTSIVDSPRLTGNVSIDTARVGTLLETLSMARPEGVTDRDLGALSGSANFDVAIGGAMTFENVTAALLGMQLNGSGRLDENSDLHAELAVPAFAPSDTVRRLAAAYVPDSIDLGAIDSLALGGIVDMNLETGAATVTDFSMTAGSATVTGEVTVEPGAAGPSYRGSVRTSRISRDLVAALMATSLSEQVGPEELGTFAIDTQFTYETPTDRATLSSLSLRAFGLEATGNVTVTSVSTDPVVEGRASVAEFSPRDFLARFGQPVPESTDPTTLTSARVTGEFVVDARRGEFRNLDVKLDDTQITGSLGVNDFESPSYRFDLRADAVDVDRYLPPPVEEAEDGERKAGDIELASEPLSAFRIDGFARVRDLRLSGMRFRAVETTLKIGDGRASITPASARLYGGEFTGGLEVDATGEIPTMSLNGQATDLNLRPLIRSLLGESNLTGTGNFDLDLTGTGPTVTDVLRTAAGTMSFALRDGAISGFNLGRTLCAAYNLSQKLPQPADAPDQTDYQLIRAAATVSDGIASSPDVLARTAFMDVTGSGRLILVDQILDYDMDAKLTNSIGIARCDSMDPLIGDSIPFTIRGPVTDADIKPDFGQILENRVRDEIRDRAEDRLRNRLEDRLRNLL